MPRGYRNIVAALVGVALAAALGVGWLLQPEKPNLPGDRSYREEAASYQPGGADCQPERLNGLSSGERGRKGDACADAEEQHREAADSLIEARRSASAADASAIAAYQQAGIAAWGTGLSIITMFAAIAAALFAERAAAHTKAGADAAEMGVAETRRIGEAQTRCYISGVAATINRPKDALTTAFIIRNSGQSPAMGLTIRAELSIMHTTTSKLRVVKEKPISAVRSMDVPIGEHTYELLTWNEDLTEEDFNELRLGGYVFLQIEAIMTFDDVFGKHSVETERFSGMITPGTIDNVSFTLTRGVKVIARQRKPQNGD